MTELINKVKDAKKVLDDSQKELLTWCRSKSEPLSKRWEIWNKYVDKTPCTNKKQFNIDT